VVIEPEHMRIRDAGAPMRRAAWPPDAGAGTVRDKDPGLEYRRHALQAASLSSFGAPRAEREAILAANSHMRIKAR